MKASRLATRRGLESNQVVSAIIPARNEEESIARAVESVAAQGEIEEVIVVNDQSTDGTGEILAELSERIPKLRVIATDELPGGWIGKNYAASVGAGEARGDWLLFTDADTYHLLGSARRALADAVDHDAVLVSYSPEQEMETFWERALIPLVYCQLSEKYSYARVNDPKLPDAAANGQYLLIRRRVYDEVGGHGAVADDLLEDVALAQVVKNGGQRIYFAAPVGVVRTRMYRSFRAMWEGWTKNLYLLLPAEPFRLGNKVIELIATLVPLAVVFFLVVRLKIRPEVAVWPVALIGLTMWHSYYALMFRRNHFPVRFIQYAWIGAWLFLIIWIVSWWKNVHGTVVWKGRKYRTGAQHS